MHHFTARLGIILGLSLTMFACDDGRLQPCAAVQR
jgi:hypothetical protein